MSERNGWVDEASRWLIHRAARRAPDPLSERLEEEWLADLATRSPGASRLRFAVGCCWATRVIAFEHQPIRTAGVVLGSKLAVANLQYTVTQFSRRSSTLFLVIALHVALFYVLMTKLSHTNIALPPPPFDVTQIQPPAVKLPPPPPIDPTIEKQVIRIDPPEFPSSIGDEGAVESVVTEPIRTSVPAAPAETLPIPPTHVVQRTLGGPGPGFPNAEDYYPDPAKRLGEQGLATVQVCVDARGRLTAEPTTVQSTGSARLDEGALKLARAASGHYRASTEDGRPVNSCYAFRIRFALRN